MVKKKAVKKVKRSSSKKSVLTGDLRKAGISAEKNEFLDEPEEHEGRHEEEELKMHRGIKTADVYTKEGREELAEDEGELAPWEEGFAEGAEKGAYGDCEHCGTPLGDRGEIIEKEIGDEVKWFCSERCAKKFKAKSREEE